MFISSALGVMGVIIFVFGLLLTIYFNIIFYLKLKKAHPELYKRFSIAWMQQDTIKQATGKDPVLLKWYKLSVQTPIIALIVFGVYIIIFILVLSMQR